jgi:hypothetical protein
MKCRKKPGGGQKPEYSLILSENLHEDELPEDLPSEIYTIWFDLSIVPDGVGCRVGPGIRRGAEVLKHDLPLPSRLRALVIENARLREAYKRLKALVMAWATYSYDDIPDTAKIKIAYGSADDEASTTFGEIRKAIEGGES